MMGGMMGMMGNGATVQGGMTPPPTAWDMANYLTGQTVERAVKGAMAWGTGNFHRNGPAPAHQTFNMQPSDPAHLQAIHNRLKDAAKAQYDVMWDMGTQGGPPPALGAAAAAAAPAVAPPAAPP